MNIDLPKYASHPKGLTHKDIEKLLGDFPQIDQGYFYNALMGNTAVLNSDNEVVNYFVDIVTAINCGLEKRDIKIEEFD